MNIIKYKQRQYIFIKTDVNLNKYIFLSSQPSSTFDHKNAIIYDVSQNKYWHYKGYQVKVEELFNEFNVLCCYKKNFKYNEKKYWQYLNIIKKSK